MTIPLVMTTAGAIPTSPLALLTALIQSVSATNPGYTANLPGSLIEDISSTDVGAMLTIDQARVDSINNVTPYGANAYVLSQMSQLFGIPQNQKTNTSAFVIFTGLNGYVIPAGFIVADGSHQYVVQDGTVIGTSGDSAPTFVVANTTGSWAVPANTITNLVTSVPTGYTLSVTNPTEGLAGAEAESVQDYRARLMEANIVTGQGVPAYIKTLLGKVPGVNPRLVSILQVVGGWEVICGGGDPYQVAGAIYLGVLDLSSIIGSVTTIRNITATITDVPNSYNITYVNPPLQAVTGTIHWNTNLGGFTAGLLVNSLAQPALTNYINGIPVGQPINELQMAKVFQDAVSTVLPIEYITTLIFEININGVLTPPDAGTYIIPGDPESYFNATVSGLTVVQG